MFDYHLHSKLSFDSSEEPAEIVRVAENKGLSEICFTDHYDFNDVFLDEFTIFSVEDYKKALDCLQSDKVLIRRGVEAGLTPRNQKEIEKILKMYDFDFVIGSIHFVGGYDPYYKEFWDHNDDIDAAFEKYFLQVKNCVNLHDNFDVLGHLNFICKSPNMPVKKDFNYNDYIDICDEIMKILVKKGIGIEINTSGVDAIGDFLPSIDFVKRFRELGGEIITVGSDSHNTERVGQYVNEALGIAKEVFGYVCTFDKRKPIFHKL